MSTTDDTLRSDDDSSRITSGRDRASTAPSRLLPPGLLAQQTPTKKTAEADHDDSSGFSAGDRCRLARRNVATIAGGASKPTTGRLPSMLLRRPIGLSQIGRQGVARPRQGPRRQRPGKQETRGLQKAWPRVFTCILWRRFPKKPRPRVGGTGFEPVTSTV